MNDGRVCVVTGGAAGLGEAVAWRFARQNDIAVVVDRNGEKAEHVARDIRDAGLHAHAFKVDVKEEDQVQALAHQLAAEFGRVDALVNNAGVALREGSILDMTRKQWDLVIAVNLTGAFLMSRYLIPLMLPKGGAVVHISTVGAVRAVPGTDAYIAAKGGLNALGSAMAVSLASQGIRVNTVAPGLFLSDEVASQMDHERLQAMLPRSGPVGRGPATSDEVAGTVVFLCSDDASYINGAVISVDGGAAC